MSETNAAPRSLFDTIVESATAGMARRLFAIRREILTLEEERERVTAQAEWMEGWHHDAAAYAFTHRDGHMLSAVVIRADGTAWPFLQMWYKLREEAS